MHEQTLPINMLGRRPDSTAGRVKLDGQKEQGVVQASEEDPLASVQSPESGV